MKNIIMKRVINETCNSPEEKKLFRAVVRQIGIGWKEVFECVENFQDASAGVSGFITYHDTHKFAARHIENIFEIVEEFEEECGSCEKPSENLLNWYAWFILEHIVQKIIRFKEDN